MACGSTRAASRGPPPRCRSASSRRRRAVWSATESGRRCAGAPPPRSLVQVDLAAPDAPQRRHSPVEIVGLADAEALAEPASAGTVVRVIVELLGWVSGLRALGAR